jgi:hypothetical protein
MVYAAFSPEGRNLMIRAISRLIAVILMTCATASAANDYAETASTLANAILAGNSEVQRDLLPPLKEEEYAELLRLADCDAYMGDGGGERYLVIEWRCGPDELLNEDNRSTVMIFDDTGRVAGFSINRSFNGFEPTQTALTQSDLPLPRTILKEFGKAVVSGGDPTLGGLIDLNSFDRARLARYANGNFRVSSKRYEGQFRISLYEGKGRFTPRRIATLQIDEAGRPTGLIFRPTYRANIRSAGDYDRSFYQSFRNRDASVYRSQPRCSGVAC